MENLEKVTQWFSINIDDTTSDLMPSFELAINDKSLYIVEKIYSSCSQTGKTPYYKYDLYSLDGEKIFLKVGNCRVVGEIIEEWGFEYGFGHVMQMDNYWRHKNNWRYPFSRFYPHDKYCFLSIEDINGKIRKIGLYDFKDHFWLFFKEFLNAGAWDKFLLSNWLKIISSKTESLYNRVLKYGYSKEEYSYEYRGNVKPDPLIHESFFKSDLKFIQEALNFCHEMIEPKYLEKKKIHN